ncbi:cell division protein FtsQ/DivIB [Rhizobium sp. SSA_523]|uniref:cell division protein FtsQ/DivIB n=1 Tax=Rhizobium sp. SSA_523 TaxID=2952477 RepID=UPI0020903124|nr:cell division protein FtsQ/DivIB [Rhizobium sp. SSA_523]MCO5730293.1 cell division protein FtsQ/DivIB [Rhizobium sp. SSA_523]WKC25669.1 cell division protein FtsQ/DivIB [Rhizobium sp. SSA_523]
MHRGHKENAGRGFGGAPEDRVVLPRPLRRTARFLVSLATGRVHIPAHTGTVGVFALFAIVGFGGMSIGGHTEEVAQATTSAAGFAIEKVRVSGNAQTSEIEILQLLGLDGTSSLVSLDVEAARLKLIELPWVESAEVRKVYPDTIDVALRERQAFAIWQHGSELSLIERDGQVIAPLRDNKFASLPLFVGRDAEKNATEFLDEMANWPDIRNRVQAFVRVASRRWDLHLGNGVVIMLPEDNLDQALKLLTEFEAKEGVLERDIASIDLRLPDRTAVRLTPDAAERRAQAVAAREKALKKAGSQT